MGFVEEAVPDVLPTNNGHHRGTGNIASEEKRKEIGASPLAINGGGVRRDSTTDPRRGRRRQSYPLDKPKLSGPKAAGATFEQLLGNFGARKVRRGNFQDAWKSNRSATFG